MWRRQSERMSLLIKKRYSAYFKNFYFSEIEDEPERYAEFGDKVCCKDTYQGLFYLLKKAPFES